MSFFRHIKQVKSELGASIGVALAIAEKATSASVAADAALIVRDKSNKAAAIKRYQFDSAEIDWTFVHKVVYAIDARKAGMNRHEARKLNALRKTADARHLVGAECALVIPLLKANARDGLTRSAFESAITGDNHRTFAVMLAKAGLATRQWTGKTWTHIGIKYDADTALFWNTLFSAVRQ